MDYKKILAATAVTTAALVIPVVADAATPADLFNAASSDFNTTLELVPVDASGSTVVFTSYKWYTVAPDGSETLLASTPSLHIPSILTAPQYRNGAEIKVVAYTADGTAYEDSITVNAMPMTNMAFYDVSLETPTPVTEALVNRPLSVEVNLLDINDTTITKYEWYVVHNNQYHLLSGETDMLLDVPTLASGKQLELVITTEAGKKYKQDVAVKKLELVDDMPMTLKLNGAKLPVENISIAPNDVLSIEDIEIIGDSGEELLLSQATISYQWYFTGQGGVPNTSSLITDATNVTYMIPTDAFFRTLQSFKVRIDIEVADAGIKKSYYSPVVTLSIAPAEDLVTKIDALFETSTTYSKTNPDFTAFEADLKALQKSYNDLSINSKPLVTNYPKLQAAISNVALVKPLIKELEVFHEAKQEFDSASSELKHAQLMKHFEALEKQYKKLDTLQRSLLELTEDFGGNYVEETFKYLKNITDLESNTDTTAQTINDINGEILDLYEDATAFVKAYNLAGESREAFSKKIVALQAKAATVDKVHRSVLHTSVLTAAKKDVRKADSIGVKIAKLTTYTGTKRVRAAESIRLDYNKLSTTQKSLVTSDELELLEYAEQTESDRIKVLLETIDALQNNGSYRAADLFPINELDYTFATVLDYLAESYKTLSISGKKLVTNYDSLKRAQKDLKATKKVIVAINKANLAHEAANDTSTEAEELKALRSAYTKYRSAYKGYIKLTTLQRSILENGNSIDDTPINEFLSNYISLTDLLNVPQSDDDDDEVEFDSGAVAQVVSLLDTLERSVTTEPSTLETVQTRIAEIRAAYKALNAAEKKNVYNYSVLAAANTVASKANAVNKKLNAALVANTEAKLTAALSAYERLTLPQQRLITAAASEVSIRLTDMQPDFTEIEEAMDALMNELSVDTIEAVTEAVQGLSQKELKKIPNYKVYEAALKHKKLIDTFIVKMDKLGEDPSYSKKQTILSAYKKLTETQTEFFERSYSAHNELIQEWNDTLTTTSQDLNNLIGGLLVGDTYYADIDGTELEFIENFRVYLEELTKQYKVLDQKEKKLVTHNRFIKIAEKDAKAVEAVITLVERFNEAEDGYKPSIFDQWERAYNRLSVQQQSLYSLSQTEDPEL